MCSPGVDLRKISVFCVSSPPLEFLSMSPRVAYYYLVILSDGFTHTSDIDTKRHNSVFFNS